MGKTKRKILEILFWIFLIIGIILLLWRILGNSPEDLSITLTFIFVLMIKMWSISDALKDDLNNLKHETKLSFHKMKTEMDDIKSNIENSKK